MNIKKLLKNQYIEDIELFLLICFYPLIDGFHDKWFDKVACIWITFELYLLNAKVHKIYKDSCSKKTFFRNLFTLHTVFVVVTVIIFATIINHVLLLFSLYATIVFIVLYWIYVFIFK